MSFKSFLSAAGHDLEKALGIGAQLVSTAAPFVVSADPAAAPYVAIAQLVSSAAIQTEQKYAALGKQNGSGASKLAEVVQITEGAIVQMLKPFGMSIDTPGVTNIVNSVVGFLNAMPAQPQLAAPAPAA